MAELLDPSNNLLEGIEIRTPVSGFLSVYDGDCLIQSISLCPPNNYWPLYWTLVNGLSFVWDLNQQIELDIRMSGVALPTQSIGQGRTDLYTLVAEVTEEEAEQRVNLRGATQDQMVAEISSVAREFEGINDMAERVSQLAITAGVSVAEATRALGEAFGSTSQAISEGLSNFGAQIEQINLGEPPEHHNCRSEIEEWRDVTSDIRSSLFTDRPQDLLDAIRGYLSDNSRDIIRANKKFSWKVRNGEVKKIHEMTSQHLFYSMRMVYNQELARHQEGAIIHWHPLVYDGSISRGDVDALNDREYNFATPASKRTILVFMYHIEERKDLPLRCMSEYNIITATMLGIRLPNQGDGSNFGSIIAGQRPIEVTRKIITKVSIKKIDGQSELRKIGVIPQGRRIHAD